VKRFFNHKPAKILMVAIAIHLLLNFLITGLFHLTSALVYFLIGIILANLVNRKTAKPETYLLVGLLLPIFYNILGHVSGYFTIDTIFVAIASIQQGLIAFIISKMDQGGK